MSEISRKDVVQHTIEEFTKEVFDLVRDGWVISPTNPGDALLSYGTTYTVSMYRDASTVDAFKKLMGGVSDRPKMTRAETLEVARAARKGKVASLDTSSVQEV